MLCYQKNCINFENLQTRYTSVNSNNKIITEKNKYNII